MTDTPEPLDTPPPLDTPDPVAPPPPDVPVEPAAVKTISTGDLNAFATLTSAEPAPGPGSRVTRTVGQAGGVTVWIALWHSFGWFGADHWSATQAADRWPAIFAVSVSVVSIVHNVTNWWLLRKRLVKLASNGGTTDV